MDILILCMYPHFDFDNFYLGEAYLRKGDKAMAIDSYRKTLQHNPSHEEAKKRLQELGSREVLEKGVKKLWLSYRLIV